MARQSEYERYRDAGRAAIERKRRHDRAFYVEEDEVLARRDKRDRRMRRRWDRYALSSRKLMANPYLIPILGVVAAILLVVFGSHYAGRLRRETDAQLGEAPAEEYSLIVADEPIPGTEASADLTEGEEALSGDAPVDGAAEEDGMLVGGDFADLADPVSGYAPKPGAFLEKSEMAASFASGYQYYRSARTQTIPEDNEDVNSHNAILIDLATGEVLAEKNADAVICPASMTKILTLLVAAEQITDLNDTYSVPIEVTDYAYKNQCSIVGFAQDETVTVRDLLYGTILPSGADAAMGLALYVAGDVESFVDLMNRKAASLGLQDDAHFGNPVGVDDGETYCTVGAMGMILKAAMENELCRQVLSERIYTTTATPEHPEGIEISNWFIRRIEDKDTHGVVLGAKTGFVDASGCCSASCHRADDGSYSVLVTVNAWSVWRCIYDHVAVYETFK